MKKRDSFKDMVLKPYEAFAVKRIVKDALNFINASLIYFFLFGPSVSNVKYYFEYIFEILDKLGSKI